MEVRLHHVQSPTMPPHIYVLNEYMCLCEDSVRIELSQDSTNKDFLWLHINDL